MVTRSTSPTAPSPSFYLRSRRADQARTIEKEVEKPTSKPERFERSVQTDETITRWSRHIGSTTSAVGGYSSPSTSSPRFSRVTSYRDSGVTSSASAEEQPKPTSDETAKCVVKVSYIEPEKLAVPKPTDIKVTKLVEKAADTNTSITKKPVVNRSTPTSSESSGSTKSAKLVHSPPIEPSAGGQNLPGSEARRSPKPEIPSSSSESSSDPSSEDEKKSQRPPRPPVASKRNEEEAKSFLIKALGPVTNLFRPNGSKSPDASKGNWSTEEERSTTSKSSRLRSDTDDSEKPTGHRQSSGERAWWLESTENIPEGIKNAPSSTSINKDSDRDTPKSDRKNYKIRCQYSGEKAWWLESTESIPGSLRRTGSTRSSRKEEKKYKIRKQESGERAWWLDSTENIPDGIVVKTESSKSLQNGEPETKYRISYQKSGERAWWMGSTESLKKKPEVIVENASNASSSESSEDEGKQQVPSPPRRRRPSSSEETVTSSVGPTPPSRTSSRLRKRPKDLSLFIGGHTNIDDILGSAGSTPAHSPVLSRPFVPSCKCLSRFSELYLNYIGGATFHTNIEYPYKNVILTWLLKFPRKM